MYILKKNLFYLLITMAALFIFDSCSPTISIVSGKEGRISIGFKTGFSHNAAMTLRSISGTDETEPIFNTKDIKTALQSFNISDVTASIPSPTEISAEGTIHKISENELCKAGVLTSSSNSITFELGPAQFKAIYAILDETSQSYFDMLMIPSLIDEEMSVKDYKLLLASLYGTTFAEELLNGKLTVALSSPDRKKQVRDVVSLGEILTLNKSKSWTVNW